MPTEGKGLYDQQILDALRFNGNNKRTRKNLVAIKDAEENGKPITPEMAYFENNPGEYRDMLPKDSEPTTQEEMHTLAAQEGLYRSMRNPEHNLSPTKIRAEAIGDRVESYPHGRIFTADRIASDTGVFTRSVSAYLSRPSNRRNHNLEFLGNSKYRKIIQK